MVDLYLVQTSTNKRISTNSASTAPGWPGICGARNESGLPSTQHPDAISSWQTRERHLCSLRFLSVWQRGSTSCVCKTPISGGSAIQHLGFSACCRPICDTSEVNQCFEPIGESPSARSVYNTCLGVISPSSTNLVYFINALLTRGSANHRIFTANIW